MIKIKAPQFKVTFLTTLILGLIPLMGHTMEPESTAKSPYKLDGIFTTKIRSLSCLNPHEYKKGDIAFFDCMNMFTDEALSFFKQIQLNGAECFGLVARRFYYQGDMEQSLFHGHKIHFSSLIEGEMSLDENSIIANGLIYRKENKSFYANEQMNAVLNVLNSKGTTFDRVFYFANDPYMLNYIVGKTMNQPATIFFIPPKESHGYYRFYLSDQPATHWAFSSDDDTKINIVRENPLILANTFEVDELNELDYKGERKKIDYKKIIGWELLHKVFDEKTITNPNLLLKTFFLDKWHINQDYFAKKLVKIYNEAIWPDVISFAKILMADTKTEVYTDNYCLEVLTGLVDAKTPDNMETYSDQVSSLFTRVTPAYLRQSCLKSLQLIPWTDREMVLEKAYSYQSGIEISTFLAGHSLLRWFYELNLMEVLPHKIPDKVSPFKFLDDLKDIDGPLLQAIIYHLPKMDEHTGYYMENLKKDLKKYNPSPELFTYIGKEVYALQTKLNAEEYLNLDNIMRIVGWELGEEKLTPAFSALSLLLKHVKSKKYDGFLTELKLLADLPDETTMLNCVKSTRFIFDLIHEKRDYLRKLLKIMTTKKSNYERYNIATDVTYFLNKHMIPAIQYCHKGPLLLSMGNECEFEQSIYNLMEETPEHRKFFQNIMDMFVPESLRLYEYSAVSSLLEDIGLIPTEKLGEAMDKIKLSKKIENWYDLDNLLDIKRW